MLDMTAHLRQMFLNNKKFQLSFYLQCIKKQVIYGNYRVVIVCCSAQVQLFSAHVRCLGVEVLCTSARGRPITFLRLEYATLWTSRP